MNVNDLTQNYTAFATEFIQTSAAAGKPFFLYCAYDNTHSSVYASERFVGSTLRGPFGDATSELDWAVGRLMDTVDSTPGAANNTVMFFVGDNGAWLVPSISPAQGSSAGTFGGEWPKNPVNSKSNGNLTYVDTGKGSTWEGGHRVPGIAWGPGVVKQGVVQQALAGTMDIFPTALSLAGVGLPADRAFDGKDITPLLKGGAGVTTPHDFFFYYSTTQHDWTNDRVFAVRHGAYKAHFATHSGFGHEPVVRHSPPLVFNVEHDPWERLPTAPPTKTWLAEVTAAVEAHVASIQKEGYPVPQLDLLDSKCMDCDGLPASMSKCCAGTGKCTTKPGARVHAFPVPAWSQYAQEPGWGMM